MTSILKNTRPSYEDKELAVYYTYPEQIKWFKKEPIKIELPKPKQIVTFYIY